ncbi:GLPGLI family protein [Chryseobacterium taichungense]|uniref:GLPGLI family protein n=1 Tax=Chryseobacterium taichungense TaxID=295069 RepID=UPI0028AF18D2|nr:GLPGLI family protein [Chryseobacterium taichungense]
MFKFKCANFLLFFYFLSGIFFCSSQNYRVLYKVNFHPQKNKTILKTEYMRLETLSKSKSIFYNQINKSDSIYSLSGNATPYLRFTITQDDKKYNYYGYFNDLFFVFNEPLKLDWQIGNKTSSFNGYKVQEAKIELDGRKWIALFASEIPITSGPYKFSGLPGLILKIYSEDGDYNFEMVELIKGSSENFSNTFQTSRYINLKKKKIANYIANFLKDPGSHSFTLQNTYGDRFDYSFSGERNSSYREMNEYIKNVHELYNNPIDNKIYILIF